MSQDKKKDTAAKTKAEAKKADEKIKTQAEVAVDSTEKLETQADAGSVAAGENTSAESKVAQEQPTAESEVQADAQTEQAPAGETEVETVPETDQKPDPKKVPGPQDAGLKPVRAWIKAGRLAAWKAAALLWAMGWTEDKRVSEAEFKRALSGALTRPQGGRRRGA